jgi:hypothetical protein
MTKARLLDTAHADKRCIGQPVSPTPTPNSGMYQSGFCHVVLNIPEKVNFCNMLKQTTK